MYAADDTFADQTFTLSAINQQVDTRDVIEDECHFISTVNDLTELNWQFQNGF